MSRIEKLIKEKCSNGVECKSLKDICDFKRGQSITIKNLKKGDYPVVAGGQEPSFYCDIYNRDYECITVSSSGAYAGCLNYWNNKILCTDSFSMTSKDKGLINNKFLYQYLKTMQDWIYSRKKGAGVPHVHISDIDKIKIPIPPIEVQEEIVKILDKFSELEEKLEAELEARKTQYEFWRNSIFRTQKNYQKSTLGTICTIKTGAKPKEIYEKGIYEYINAGTTNSGYLNITNANKDCVTTPSRGQGGIGFVGYQSNDFWCGPLCYQIRSKSDSIINKYIYYWMCNNKSYILKLKHEGGVPALNIKELQEMPIIYPSLEEQECIVKKLDKFDKLINDISEGIPAEIEARRKQYEYYRNKLLSFEELKDEKN